MFVSFENKGHEFFFRRPW